jgi:hypothetical protein
MATQTTLVDAFGRQATEGLRRWVGRVGSRWGGIDLVGSGEMDGVDKAYYASGRELPEFDSAGARNWKLHSTDPGVESGAPELIPGLPFFKTKGQTWIEWLLPEDYTTGDDTPQAILWMLRCLKVWDYTLSGGDLVRSASKIFSANNALVSLFIGTERIRRPLSGFHGADWMAFRDRCSGTITFDGGTGLKGEYFDGDALAGAPKITRNDAYVDFTWDGVFPSPAIGADPWSARWTGKVKPQFGETYTFYTKSDDGARLSVNGVQLVNDWADGAEREQSGQVALSAGAEYDIVLEYYQRRGPARIALSWSSASRPKQIVPQDRLSPGARQVERFDAHVAFPQTLPAPTAFESVMRRAPGCDWYKANGKVRVWSSPDRPVLKRFTYDLSQLARLPNVVDGSFKMRPRSREDQPDYATFTFFDLDDALYKERTFTVDRRADKTKPPKSPIGPVPLGVCGWSLASRIGASEMNLIALSMTTDLAGFADSYNVVRGGVVETSHEVPGWRESSPPRLMITEEQFLTRGVADDRRFSARLHAPDYYSDDAHEALPPRVVSDIPSPFVAPPAVVSVAMLRADRWLPDDTDVPLIQGVVRFAAHPYTQRGRVWLKRPMKPFTADAGTDALTSVNHGFAEGQKVEVITSGTLPAPLAVATPYYVRDVTQGSFKLSATPGGVVINLTSAGTGANDVRELDFVDTGILVVPDPATLRGTFEIENVSLGRHDVRVVAESLKGVSRGLGDAQSYQVVIESRANVSTPAGLAIANVTRAGLRLTWSASPEVYVVGYKVERYNGSAWSVVAARVDSLEWSDPASFDGAQYRVTALGRGGLDSAASAAVTFEASTLFGTTAPVVSVITLKGTASFLVSPPAGMMQTGRDAILRIRARVTTYDSSSNVPNENFYWFEASAKPSQINFPAPLRKGAVYEVDINLAYQFFGGALGTETLAAVIGNYSTQQQSGDTLVSASETSPGVVSIVAQTFGGEKTVTAPGGARFLGYTTSALPPSTTELPSDKDWCFHYDTALSKLYAAFNISGTIKKVELT